MRKPFKSAINLILFFCFALLLLFPAVALGQITNVTDDQSTPRPGTGHDYIKMVNETVDPANGSVSIRIGPPVPQGRGLTLPFSIAYDSNGAMHAVADSTGIGSWWSNTGFGYGGWSNTLPMLSWSYRSNAPYCDYLTDFVFQDPTGGRHFLGLATNVDSPGCWPAVSQLYSCDDLFCAITQSYVNFLMVADLITGTAYSFSISPQALNGVAQFVEDRNGNRVTLGGSSSSTTVTDTLGRTLTVGSGSPQSVQVPGLANPYQVYWAAGGGTNPAVGQTADSGNSYDPNCAQGTPIYPYGTGSGGVQVVTSVTLPNLQQYQFSYDSTFGLLSQITYPTGGWVKYSWGWNSRAEHIYLADTVGDQGACGWTYDVPAVTERQVSFDGSTVALDQHFNYSTNWSAQTYKTTTVTSVDNIAGATTVTQYAYNFYPTPTGPYDGPNSGGLVPIESSVTYEDGSNKIYRMVNKSWNDQYMMSCESTTEYSNGAAGPTSRTDYNPGAVWPWASKKEWDWNQAPACGNPATNSPTRETDVTITGFPVQVYPASYFTYNTVPYFSRPLRVTTNYNGAQAAQTTYVYDGSSLTSAGVTMGRDSQFNGNSMTSRGNATSKTEWLNTGGQSPLTTYTYDDTGQKLSMTDPCGNASCSDMTGSNHTTSYSYSNYDAYLSQVSYPPTNGTSHTREYTYNFADGQLATSVDVENNLTASYSYGQNGELLDRLTSISYPDGGSTTYSYDSICGNPATTTILLSGSSYYTQTATMDAMCHTTRTAVTSDSSPDYVDTTYTGLGQVYTVSNPYRSQSDTSYGVTTTSYDPLGRVISVASPDGSGTTTTYFASNNMECSQVTDPGGVSRTPCSDALGRLLQVTENGLSATTSYAYNGLDALLSVTQGGQTRTFGYDSLKRLTSASNPEVSVSGTPCPVSYSYDANGNLSSKAAPLENQPTSCSQTVTTTYNYDVLNRLGYKQYSDGTPTANFFYDVAPGSWPGWSGVSFSYATGGMTVACTGSTAGTCSSPQTAVAYSYDKMGRPAYYWQCTPLNCGNSSIWQTAYTYDAAGDVTSWVHPQPFTITQLINGARQVQSVTSSLSDSTHPSALATITYSPFGSVSTLQNGCVGSGCTQIEETYFYNKRTQMAVAELGTSGTHWQDACRVYNYYETAQNVSACSSSAAEQPSSWPAGTDNNGNVAGYYYVDPMNNGALDHTATYKYTDGVNRLNQAYATGNVAYDETFTYDQYGNMTCSASPAEPQCLATTYNPNNINQISYFTVNNVNTNYNYDAAGNLISDGSHGYQWDAEGRLVSVDGAVGQACPSPMTWTACHTYNALGQRVRDVTQAKTTDEAYGAGGNLLWRYTGNSTDPNQRAFVPFSGGILAEYYGGSPGGTIFDHPDEIGSATIASDYTGNNFQERLYLPFGEFWTGVGSLGMHQTFAKLADYDPETDQYNTPARHYTPSGRWLSPDPDNAGAQPGDPQTWNMYAYVRNNPTSLTDPTGLLIDFNCTNASIAECTQATDDVNIQVDGAFTVGRNSDSSLYVVNQSAVDLSKLSDANKALFNAITDTSQTATVNIVGNTGQSDFGDHVSKGVNTVDMGNLAHLGDSTNQGGLTPGGALAHEMMDAWNSLSESAEKADQEASKLFPGLSPPDPATNRNQWNAFSTQLLGSSYNQATTNGHGSERVSIQYIKPIPAIDLFGKSGAGRNDVTKAAGSRVTGVTFVP